MKDFNSYFESIPELETERLRLTAFLLILAMVLSLGVTAFAEDRREIASAEFPFYLMDDDSGEKVTLYFLDGVNDLPYVELRDWMDLLNMIIGDEDDESSYRLSLETAGPVACYTRENGFTMVMDFEENFFRFQDYNYFMKLPNMSTLLDFTSKDCFNEAGEPALIKKSDSYSFDRYGDELVIRLGDYGIDLIQQEGLYLVPLQTMCDFTLAPNKGFNFFFNGQCLILADKLSAAKVTLLGRTSGGGSCTVLTASSAWGTSFTISSQTRMSFLKNGALYDIDRGADPDYTISTPEKYYDREALTDYINTLY